MAGANMATLEPTSRTRSKLRELVELQRNRLGGPTIGAQEQAP